MGSKSRKIKTSKREHCLTFTLVSKINILTAEDEDKVLARIAEWYKRTGAVIEDLNYDEQQILKGIEQAHALMTTTDPHNQEQWADRNYVVGVLSKEFDVSISTAYKYIDLANKLRATETVAQHNYRRLLVSRLLEKMMKKAETANDFKGFERLSRLYVEINNLTQAMQEERNWQEVLAAKQIILTPNPEALNRDEPIDEATARATILKLETKAKRKSLGLRDEQ